MIRYEIHSEVSQFAAAFLDGVKTANAEKGKMENAEKDKIAIGERGKMANAEKGKNRQLGRNIGF